MELIGALWVTGYLFALVGATVAHELTHRSSKTARLVAQILLGFTGNASFVIYHVHIHHRQVGTYNDASTARRGERLRTFVARTLVQQFTQAAHVEAARLRRKGLPVWSWHNRLIQAHLAPLSILVLALIIGGPAGLLADLPRRPARTPIPRAHQLRAAFWSGARREYADPAASQLGQLPDDFQHSALQSAASLRPSHVCHEALLAVGCLG